MNIISVLWYQFTTFYPFFGVQGRLPVTHCHWGLGGSRCSEMHSQPYGSTLTFLYIKICIMASYNSLFVCMLLYIYYQISKLYVTVYASSLSHFLNVLGSLTDVGYRWYVLNVYADIIFWGDIHFFLAPSHITFRGKDSLKQYKLATLHKQFLSNYLSMICNVWIKNNIPSCKMKAQFFFIDSALTCFLFTVFQGSIVFFKEFQGTISLFTSIHAPTPKLSEIHCLSLLMHVLFFLVA